MHYTDYIPVTFVDQNSSVITALVNRFKTSAFDCQFLIGDIFQQGPGTLVSPANCQGNMDGGIDKVYSDYFPGIESKLATYIRENHGNELKFGEAQIVPTGNNKFPHIIFSPTVGSPGELARKENIYGATKAILTEALRYNIKGHTGTQIQRLLIPGMGTGFGNMDPIKSANEVYKAFEEVESSIEVSKIF